MDKVPRYPSILPVSRNVFCWLYPGPGIDLAPGVVLAPRNRYELVDWETATPEDMELWRRHLALVMPKMEDR